MRGRRPGKTGGVFAGIHRGFFRAENDADGRGSFAAVEQSMSDRLLGPFLPGPQPPCRNHPIHTLNGFEHLFEMAGV